MTGLPYADLMPFLWYGLGFFSGAFVVARLWRLANDLHARASQDTRRAP